MCPVPGSETTSPFDVVITASRKPSPSRSVTAIAVGLPETVGSAETERLSSTNCWLTNLNSTRALPCRLSASSSVCPSSAKSPVASATGSSNGSWRGATWLVQLGDMLAPTQTNSTFAGGP